MAKTNQERQTEFRRRQAERGFVECTFWIPESQLVFLERLAKDLKVTKSEAAEYLMFKTSSAIKAGIINVR